MSWSEIAAVLNSQELIGVTVAGGVATGNGQADFYLDHWKIYLEFEDCFVELRRMAELEDGFKLKVSLMTDVVHEMVQEGDEMTNAVSSITDILLPDAWDYAVVGLKVFLAAESSFEEGIADYVAIEIAHGSKIFPELFSHTTLIVHPFCLFGVQIQVDNKFSHWIVDASHDREGRYIYKKP